MISAGEVWVANIPYIDMRAAKKRPVLVLWVDAADVVVCAITTAQPRSATDVLLGDWKTSGLRAASTVRLSRLDCLEQTLMIHRLGMLSAADAQNIKTAWIQHVRPQF